MKLRFGIGKRVGPFFVGATFGGKSKPKKTHSQRIRITYTVGQTAEKKRWRDSYLFWFSLAAISVICLIAGFPTYATGGFDGSEIAALLLMAGLAVLFFIIGQKKRVATQAEDAGEATVLEPPVAAEPSKSFSASCASLSEIDQMEGHQFESWCAGLLEKLGYLNVSVTPGSGDQGVDVLAEKDGIRYAVQCKCYSADLGNKPVQEVYAGKSIYRCHVGVVMTNRYFTQGAKDAAAATDVLLWDRDKICEMVESISEKSCDPAAED